MSQEKKISCGDAEVFVLPPNLLEKLGINLCNIPQNAHQLPEPKKRKKNKQSLKNGSYSNHEGIHCDPKSLNKNEQSSILETADLMKKSVLLSPTFVPMVVNAIPGEVEIVNNIDSPVDLSNSAGINVEMIVNDSNSNEEHVELEKWPCSGLNTKQYSTSKALDSSLKCNGNGLVSESKKTGHDLSNCIQINNLGIKSKSSNENGIKDDMQVSSTSLSMKNNVPIIPPNHIQDDSHISKLLYHLRANTDNMIYEKSNDNIVQDLSIPTNFNKVDDIVSGVVIDTVESNKKYFVNNNSTLEIDEALIIPLSMTQEPTSTINLKDINGDSDHININIFQSLSEHDSDESDASRKQKQIHEACKSAQVVHTNDGNIDIIKYTECDDCSDMELENILHETEILVANTEAIESSHDKVVNVIDKKVNHTNSQKDLSDRHDLCNSIEENKILISILPELMDTSSLGIFCEQNISNAFDMGNVNSNQKLMTPISITSESIQQTQSHEVNMDTISYVEYHETSNKGDIALDNISEILIPLPLPSDSINNNDFEISNISYTEKVSPSNKLLIEKEVEKEMNQNEVPNLLSTKSPNVSGNDVTDQISGNRMVVDNNVNTHVEDYFEVKHSSKGNTRDVAENIVGNKNIIVTKTSEHHIQNPKHNYLMKESKDNKNYELKNVHKAELGKSDKDKSDETLSMNKQIENNQFKDELILHDQHNLSNMTCARLQNDHVNGIIEEKVQEIAKYLKQVIQNKSKRRHNNKSVGKILKSKHESLTKSKIFIQGVEKPGGSEEYEINLDKLNIHTTYERKEKRVKANLIPKIETALLKGVTKPEENYIEINTCIEQTRSSRRQEYCLCGDFGKLTFFDDHDNLYEHIHFESSKSVNCPVDILFEIYNNENIIINKIDEREYIPEKNNCPEDEDYHICWQKVEYQDNKYARPELKPNKQNECIKDWDLKADVSLTKSNSSMREKELETVNISEQETKKTQGEDMSDNNIVSSEISDTSLMEVIMEAQSEITPSVNPDPTTSVSHIHIKSKVNLLHQPIYVPTARARASLNSKENEANKQQQSCRTIDVSLDTEADEVSNNNVESKEKADNIQPHPSEIIAKTVEFEADTVTHMHVESREKEDDTEHQSCEIVNKSTEVAAQRASHSESKEKEDTPHQQVCKTIDKSVENTPEKYIHETENMRNETMVSNVDCLESVKKTRDHQKGSKRKISKVSEEPPTKKSEKCGVCHQVFAHSEWDDHVSSVHCYIAWKEGQTVDLDNLLLLRKLKKKLQSDGKLVCSFCEFKSGKLEQFLSHVKKCVTNEVSKSKSDKRKKPKEVASKLGSNKCGVCHLEVEDVNWVGHISEEHHYLAWREGERPLNTSDENEVKSHLLSLVKIYGQLICTKCGLLRKYTPKSIKTYLNHIKKCQNRNPTELSLSLVKTEPSTTESEPSSSTYKCGVCSEIVDVSKWFEHIAQEHNYRAWKDGDIAPDLEDKNVLWEHLNEISKQAGGLHCSKCGLVRKYVKPYLQHVNHCTGNEEVSVTNPDLSKDANKQNSMESHEASTERDVPNSTGTPSTSKKESKTDMVTAKVSCGVCNEAVQESAWIDHIGKEHNYLAWRDGDTPLDTNNKEEVWQHLHNIVGTAGKLVCAKCGKVLKYPKKYLQHMRNCRGPDTTVLDDSMNESLNYSIISYLDRSLRGLNLDASVKEVKCGVCQELVGKEAWIAHIQSAHDYVAWIDGETPLDSNNEDMIRDHLQQIVDEIGVLSCPKCGTTRKYAKKFLQHIKQCTAEKSTGKHKGPSTSNQSISQHESAECAVCKQSVRINQWINHIRTTHNYVASKQCQPYIKTPKMAKKRLQTLIDRLGELSCPKCGYKGKDVELYLQHSESCKGNLDNQVEDEEVTKLALEGLYQCAMCSEKIKYGEWREHSMSKHYTVAWVIGDEPIDVFNQNEIAKILKEYQQYGEFICKVCGITRSSGLGFFAHVISCGLNEEESDKYKLTCDICNLKYPGFYKSQHMAAHWQQEFAKYRKDIAEEDREREKQRKLDDLVPISGRRRAAEKARMVIEETVTQCKHVCQLCAFVTDAEEDMARHKCPKKRKLSDELDISLEQDDSSDEEALPVIEESSDDDDEDTKEKKKRPDSCHPKVIRMPFTVSNIQDYVTNNVRDYTKTYLTTATLFPEWTKSHCEAVTGDELREFMPPLEESCQVHSNGSWRTYKRWEAAVEKEKTTLFTGAIIQRICWLPALTSSEDQVNCNLLAVACHSGSEFPQNNVDDLSEHKALVQLWDFGDFISAPKLAFCLALQHGTVWALDWCPSGAREPPPTDSTGFVRMGLLAVACSNGMAYIYSVPYPSFAVASDSIIHKLEPVAQLKFTIKSDRKLYQATSICWSQQKGHETIIVGYSDGSTAYYDLKTESPFLKSQEKNVTIFYPFYEEHAHNGSITDMDTFPMARSSSVVGAVCMTSPTGSVLSSHGGSHSCGRMRTHLASSTTTFLPAWPSALLAGEDVATNLAPSELDYWGMGRRVGFLQAACGCQHCALVATFMAPFLRIMRPHHARTDLKKQVVAWIGMKQLQKKRKQNDDMTAVKLEEAVTYEEAVTKYGIQFKMLDKNSKEELKKSMSQYKELNPECFPIAEVPSMAYCPTAKHHKRLAIATHAGLIFVLHV